MNSRRFMCPLKARLVEGLKRSTLRPAAGEPVASEFFRFWTKTDKAGF